LLHFPWYRSLTPVATTTRAVTLRPFLTVACTTRFYLPLRCRCFVTAVHHYTLRLDCCVDVPHLCTGLRLPLRYVCLHFITCRLHTFTCTDVATSYRSRCAACVGYGYRAINVFTCLPLLVVCWFSAVVVAYVPHAFYCLRHHRTVTMRYCRFLRSFALPCGYVRFACCVWLHRMDSHRLTVTVADLFCCLPRVTARLDSARSTCHRPPPTFTVPWITPFTLRRSAVYFVVG